MARGLLAGVTLSLLALTPMPTASETLADAIAVAYRSNPSLQATRYDLRAADEDIVQARAQLRPSATLTASTGYSTFQSGRPNGPADPARGQLYSNNSNQVQLVVTQPLFTGGRATADRVAAEAGVRAGREALRGEEGDLLLGVITAYVDVRRSEQSVAVWRVSVGELDQLSKEIAARQQAGELTRTDIAQAESQTMSARQQLVAAEQALEAARADYAALTGRAPGALAEEPPLPQLPQNVDAAFDTAARSSPDLARATASEAGSRAQIGAARSLGQPTLSVRGSGAISGDSLPWYPTRQDRGYSATLVLSAPLSAGGRIASQVRQAEERNSADRLRIEDTRRQVLRSVTNAWNQMVGTDRVAKLLEEQRGAAAIQLEGTLAEYRVGLRSTFDLLYAQQRLRDAEIALLQSRRDRYVSQATLLRRTGLLEARALMTGVPLHDPTTHLRAVQNRNAVPWEGPIGMIDRAANRLVARPITVERPAAAQTPAIATALTPAPGAGAPFARSTPIVPGRRSFGRSRSLPERDTP